MVNYYEFVDRKTVKPAPRPLRVNNEDIITTDEKIYNDNGYYKLIRENQPISEALTQGDEPREIDVYYPYYELEENIIYQRWEKIESGAE